MGRQIKRVPLDFAWPLNKVWEGFQNRLSEGYSRTCATCGGSGESPEAKRLHDSINCWVCVRAKCERMGLPATCAVCGGEGGYWSSEERKALYEAWTPTEPPVGEGWQLWETVSDGSPISPVFATSEVFSAYLAGEGYSAAAIEGFIESGWAPSMVTNGGELYRDIEACALS